MYSCLYLYLYLQNKPAETGTSDLSDAVCRNATSFLLRMPQSLEQGADFTMRVSKLSFLQLDTDETQFLMETFY